ncbi:MAG: hypothetical protein AAGC79_01635 [Pseudomonadota bacterium]
MVGEVSVPSGEPGSEQEANLRSLQASLNAQIDAVESTVANDIFGATFPIVGRALLNSTGQLDFLGCLQAEINTAFQNVIDDLGAIGVPGLGDEGIGPAVDPSVLDLRDELNAITGISASLNLSNDLVIRIDGSEEISLDLAIAAGLGVENRSLIENAAELGTSVTAAYNLDFIGKWGNGSVAALKVVSPAVSSQALHTVEALLGFVRYQWHRSVSKADFLLMGIVKIKAQHQSFMRVIAIKTFTTKELP